MKYIDADKLIAEIEKRRDNALERQKNLEKIGQVDVLNEMIAFELNKILSFIISLQQDQPEVDLVAELEHHLATTPKEELEKEWKELEHWNNVGPTVQEFLYGKQPEVDLEKEVKAYIKDNFTITDEVAQIPEEDRRYSMWEDDMVAFARYFWNKGYNARKEE